MLAAMLPVADVTVSLCCDQAPDQADDGVFSGARRVANTLKSMAASAGVPQRNPPDPGYAPQRCPCAGGAWPLLADPTYTPEAEVDPAAPAITYYKADSRQAESQGRGGSRQSACPCGCAV